MPLKGRQRTQHQKAQTAAMRKRRWLPKSHAEAETISPENHRLLSEERKKYEKELEEVQRLEFNARRREHQAREREHLVQEALVKAEQEWAREVDKAVEEQYGEQFEEWKREKEGLRKDIARLNARNRREPSKIRHAVQKALKKRDNSNAHLNSS